jgi:hypothetical protein
VRAFLNAHVVRAGATGGGDGGPPQDAAPAPSTDEPWERLAKGLAEGTLNKEAAKTLALDALLSKGRTPSGGSIGGSNNGAGSSWGED